MEKTEIKIHYLIWCCAVSTIYCDVQFCTHQIWSKFFLRYKHIMYIGRVAIKNIFAHLAHFWHDLAKLPSHHIKQKQQPILKS